MRLPYLGSISTTFARLLKPLGLRPGLVWSLFRSPKNHIPALQRSGVYMLQCSDCPATYIGESGRQMFTRVCEQVDETASSSSSEKICFRSASRVYES